MYWSIYGGWGEWKIELEYPGQIKVNVIRETKAVEYAK